MSDEEIMKKFQESFSKETKKDVSPYKATSNLNTEISNPNISINDKMNLNIQNDEIEDSDEKSSDVMTMDELLKVDNSSEEKEESVNYQYIDTTEVEDPEKKKIKINLNLTSETKIALLIALVLFVFIMLIPGVHDLFRSIVSN